MGQIVIKSNEMIQTKKIETMTNTQLKVLNLMISKLDNRKLTQDMKKEDLTFQFTTKELFDVLRIKEEEFSYTRFQKQIRELSKKQVQEVGKKSFLFINIFSYIYFKGGVLSGQINDNVLLYFLELKTNFTQYFLDNITPLKSKYSILMYELLKSNQFKKQKILIFELSYLMEKLQIEKESLKMFKNFNRHILRLTQGEINTNTDLKFHYSTITQEKTKKVVSIKFEILENEINNRTIENNFRMFLKHIRMNYRNQTIIKIKTFKDIDGPFELSINHKNQLYFLNSDIKINKESSKKMWEYLFQNQSILYKYTPPLF